MEASASPSVFRLLPTSTSRTAHLHMLIKTARFEHDLSAKALGLGVHRVRHGLGDAQVGLPVRLFIKAPARLPLALAHQQHEPSQLG